MGMEPPRRVQRLAECDAQQSVPGACSGLEFCLKAFAEWIDKIGSASRRFEPEQGGHLRPARLVIEEPVLTKNDHVADARRAATIMDRCRVGRIVLYA